MPGTAGKKLELSEISTIRARDTTHSASGLNRVRWNQLLTSYKLSSVGTNGLPLATAGPFVHVRSSGMDRSESTLLGMQKVTGGFFRV